MWCLKSWVALKKHIISIILNNEGLLIHSRAALGNIMAIHRPALLGGSRAVLLATNRHQMNEWIVDNVTGNDRFGIRLIGIRKIRKLLNAPKSSLLLLKVKSK